MALRLVVRMGRSETRHILGAGESTVGSAADCAIRINEPTVSRQHAVIRVCGVYTEIEDLCSRNGTLLRGLRLTGCQPLEVGDAIAFGGVSAMLEEVPDGDLDAAVRIVGAPLHSENAPVVSHAASTDSVGSLVTFALEGLPALVERLAQGADRQAMARAVGAALFESLPCLAVEVTSESASGVGVVFSAARAEKPDSGCPVIEKAGALTVHVRFPGSGQARTYGRAVRAAALLCLVPRERPGAPERGTAISPPPLPDPPTVVPAVRKLYSDAVRVARGDVSVLITGESGTGKEVLARYLHGASPRHAGPFVALNCAALPRDLLEAELFGIEKGVATGVESRPGRFELAHQGTLFLDEIGDMPAEVQAKILRVLQEGSVYRLGGRDPRPANVRIVSATNRDIDRMLADGVFRVDLYHRIADWRAHLPPLRERRADIPNLAAHFLTREAERLGVRPGGISRTALAAIESHGWPGNVRQLERELARAVLFLEDGELLETRHLQSALLATVSGKAPDRTLRAILDGAERRAICEALAECSGDTSAAATQLDIGRSTLYRRIKELGIAITE